MSIDTRPSVSYETLLSSATIQSEKIALAWCRRERNSDRAKLVADFRNKGANSIDLSQFEIYNSPHWHPEYLGEKNGQKRLRIHEINAFGATTLGLIQFLCGAYLSVSETNQDGLELVHSIYPRPYEKSVMQGFLEKAQGGTVQNIPLDIDPANSLVITFTKKQYNELLSLAISAINQ